eukprot:TRINITY_DN9780_c0_g3_i1.p1 TRINITY_DN9780_c0_g3~~TRINITY_DN9780_c0_g3_i1.p1  ORF type:complete len:133 (+),score=45.65 TRINITY_DN9780_c0_g3_i1:57-401(+)
MKDEAKTKPLGKEKATNRLLSIFKKMESDDGDGKLTVAEVKEIIEKCGSEIVKEVIARKQYHAERIFTEENFLSLVEEGMACEDLTLDTLTAKHIKYFKKLFLTVENDSDSDSS